MTRHPKLGAVDVMFQDVVVHSVENWEAEFANNSNPGDRMDYHHHARLTIHSREQLARKVLQGVLSLNSAAAEFKLSRQSAAKWVRRFRQGDAAMADRSSRPQRSPRSTSPNSPRTSKRYAASAGLACASRKPPT